MRSLLFALLAATPAAAQDWTPLTVPAANPAAIIISNPLQGYYSYEYPGIIPQTPAAPDHYLRFAWMEIEKSEGQYDFSRIDDRLAQLKPGERISIAVMPMDTCCSRTGIDVPDYITRQEKGFWIKADPGNARHVDKVYVPDWNDPWYQERWRALWVAMGAKYDGDPRIAWVELRSYGNWGEGHVAGANAYKWSQFPYDDPTVNLHGAQPGSEASRFALMDAIIDALPHTQLISMTDDKAALLHALKRSPAIGIRRDSWGATWFDEGLLQGVADADRPLILDRWKTAPFIVESFGWTRVFEVGLDGLTRQIEQYHISAIGNGGFNVSQWSELTPDQQAALIRAGNRAGYRYVPVAADYRSTAQCPLEVRMTWRNDGVAPAYAPLRLHLQVDGTDVAGSTDLPRVMPGETQTSDDCFTIAPGQHHLSFMVKDTAGRDVLLPVSGDDLGTATTGQ